MDLRSLALEQIIAVDPRRSIDRTLGLLLLDRTDATCAALFVLRARAGPELVASRGVDQQLAVERVFATWAEDEHTLRAGTAAAMDHWCVWPLSDGRRTIGLVYVAAPHVVQIDVGAAIAGLGDLLAIALELEALPAAGTSTAIDSYVETTPLEDIERRQLEMLMTKHEWNISRVARLLGVTRKTVYNRLARLGIERVRIIKALTQ